jgi:hypothetical protein
MKNKKIKKLILSKVNFKLVCFLCPFNMNSLCQICDNYMNGTNKVTTQKIEENENS